MPDPKYDKIEINGAEMKICLEFPKKQEAEEPKPEAPAAEIRSAEEPKPAEPTASAEEPKAEEPKAPAAEPETQEEGVKGRFSNVPVSRLEDPDNIQKQ